MKQVFLSGQGEISVLDVPVPGRLQNSLLVRNHYSLISSGTEGAAVTKHRGLLGIYEKAVSSGDRIQQVWTMAKTQGVRQTYEIVRNKLSDYTAIGYSSVGTVVEVDDERMPFRPGDMVACMGTGYASHAEYVVVPHNLALPVPAGVEPGQAAFGALACIAMQGIRRLELTPGEQVGVIGLGLIGQIAIRLLSGMGYRPYGMDLSKDRVSIVADDIPNSEVWTLDSCDSFQRIQLLTNKNGLDGVLVCAATDSNEPVNLAFDLCRKSGRVSIVGDVGMSLERAKMYAKELELRISCSYGPGRYDLEYEIRGNDYPVSHIRWTEGRNLEHFLWMLQTGKLDLKNLITGVFPVEKASEAYKQIKIGGAKNLGVLIDYGEIPNLEHAQQEARAGALLELGKKTPAFISSLGDGPVRLGIIGVGGYVRNMHLPNLKKLDKDFAVRSLVSRTGASAALAAKKFEVASAGSDHRAILDNPDIDAVIIGTRHAAHARFAIEALEAGKHIFVEKPMTTSVEDAQRIVDLSESKGLIVRVGFNRRFSPHIHLLREIVGEAGTRIFYARVNIGALGKDWSNTEEEGGRLLGEAVHFYDLANWFMDDQPTAIHASMAGLPENTNPNASVLLGYPDGSHANILYTTLGDKRMGKEFFEVFGNSKSARMEDYTRFKCWGRKLRRKLVRGDKGQQGCLYEFAQAVRGHKHPIKGADARAGMLATRIALKAIEQSRSLLSDSF